MWQRLSTRFASRADASILSALRAHPLFPLVLDPAWYASRYRDVLASGTDPTGHFLGPGLVEGRDPGPCVDISFVRTQKSGSVVGNAALLLELLEHGFEDGWRPSPYVDLKWYAENNSDAPDTPSETFQHLVSTGLPEGRPTGPFMDLEAYASEIPDILSGGIDPYLYFTALGQHLSRFPHPAWDESAYLDSNEYVRFALGMGKHLHGFEQFCATGHEEVARGAILLPVRAGPEAKSVEFSEERYLAANPDVAELVAAGQVPNGVTHFFAVGYREVRNGQRKLAQPVPTALLLPEPWIRPSVNGAARCLMGLVHHDVDEILDPHVLTAIDTYRDADIAVHVVSSGIDADGREELRRRGVPLFLRSHNDDLRDFGAWNLLLEHLGPAGFSDYERVILANDSVYFPVRDPERFFEEMYSSDAEMWSATDSFAGGRYHLQSFFLALTQPAVTLLVPEIARRAILHPHPTKLGLVQWFEIGLSQFGAAEGLRLSAFHSVATLDDPASMLSPPAPREMSRLAVTITNQTHHFWRTGLMRGLPTLKVDLLRENPLGVDIAGWEGMVDGPCSAELITAHLTRVRR